MLSKPTTPCIAAFWRHEPAESPGRASTDFPLHQPKVLLLSQAKGVPVRTALGGATGKSKEWRRTRRTKKSQNSSTTPLRELPGRTRSTARVVSDRQTNPIIERISNGGRESQTIAQASLAEYHFAELVAELLTFVRIRGVSETLESIVNSSLSTSFSFQPGTKKRRNDSIRRNTSQDHKNRCPY
jgi:hypothetical protein